MNECCSVVKSKKERPTNLHLILDGTSYQQEQSTPSILPTERGREQRVTFAETDGKESESGLSVLLAMA